VAPLQQAPAGPAAGHRPNPHGGNAVAPLQLAREVPSDRVVQVSTVETPWPHFSWSRKSWMRQPSPSPRRRRRGPITGGSPSPATRSGAASPRRDVVAPLQLGNVQDAPRAGGGRSPWGNAVAPLQRVRAVRERAHRLIPTAGTPWPHYSNQAAVTGTGGTERLHGGDAVAPLQHLRERPDQDRDYQSPQPAGRGPIAAESASHHPPARAGPQPVAIAPLRSSSAFDGGQQTGSNRHP
jgi:hypothetical protein